MADSSTARHTADTPAGRSPAISPPLVFVAAAMSQYTGASIAVRTFDRVPPVGVAWWRQAGAAITLLALRRPWRRSWTARELRGAVALGLVTAAMNTLFYVAIATIPLGTAVAIEFIGPICVGAITARSRRGLTAVALGGIGVATLAGIEPSASAGGLAAIAAAAACWAGYILVGKRVSGDTGIDGLAVGSTVAALALAVPMWHWSGRALDGGIGLVSAVAAVGVLSNAIPYSLDQWVLRAIGTSRFSVLLAILPATAVVAGVLLLSQRPSPVELLGTGLVVVAVLVSETAPPDPPLDGS